MARFPFTGVVEMADMRLALVLNAINPETSAELYDAFSRFRDDDDGGATFEFEHGSAASDQLQQRSFDVDQPDLQAGCAGRGRHHRRREVLRRRLVRSSQVICVTHLPQIACFADHHYVVGKFERAGRTVAEISELDARASTEEIGRMLSGEQLTPEALRNAEELVRAARA